MAKKDTGELPKHALDNRSRQLNSENDAYWSARGLERPTQDSGAQPPSAELPATKDGANTSTK